MPSLRVRSELAPIVGVDMKVSPDSAPIVEIRTRRSLVVAGSVIILIALALADWSRDPRRQYSNAAALRLIAAYQTTPCPLHLIVRCRYQETCSQYAKRIFREH